MPTLIYNKQKYIIHKSISFNLSELERFLYCGNLRAFTSCV